MRIPGARQSQPGLRLEVGLEQREEAKGIAGEGIACAEERGPSSPASVFRDRQQRLFLGLVFGE